MMEDSIDVIIPCSKFDSSTIRALDSIKSQSISPNHIYFIYNSNVLLSRDEMELLSMFEVTLICLPEAIGPSAARNLGLSLSRSEYAAFLDCDDYWVNNKLDIQLQYMKLNRIDVCVSDFKLESTDGSLIRYSKNGKILISGVKRSSHFGFGSTGMVRNSSCNGIRFDETLFRFEDWDFLLQVMSRGLVFLIVNKF